MKYCAECACIELTVDELCAMAHRSGSLDARRPQRSNVRADQRKLKLPKEKGREQSVPLRNTLSYHGVTYTVEGVADAVIEASATVEEIKVSRSGYVSKDAYSRLRVLAYFYAASKRNG